ncbi:MAG: 50S ribosomal protein L24 [Gammaproteobacteria bacterium]|nr:50S ribosomal protein L24 [Gammaproteobacteria bacterium]
MACKIKKNDMVVLLAGKSKGQQGKVLKILSEKKILVEGANLVKKHVKPNPQLNQQGGIMEREAPVDISNVAIYNPITKKADRVGFKVLDDGRKARYFKSNGELIDAK